MDEMDEEFFVISLLSAAASLNRRITGSSKEQSGDGGTSRNIRSATCIFSTASANDIPHKYKCSPANLPSQIGVCLSVLARCFFLAALATYLRLTCSSPSPSFYFGLPEWSRLSSFSVEFLGGVASLGRLHKHRVLRGQLIFEIFWRFWHCLWGWGSIMRHEVVYHVRSSEWFLRKNSSPKENVHFTIHPTFCWCLYHLKKIFNVKVQLKTHSCRVLESLSSVWTLENLESHHFSFYTQIHASMCWICDDIVSSSDLIW